MTVTERLMLPGAWSLTFKPDTPPSVLDAVSVDDNAFGHIVITANHVDHLALSGSDLLGIARYTGIFRERPSKFDIGGPGLAAWLGDEDGKGDIIETALTKTNGTFVQWVTSIRPSSLTAGTYSAVGGTLTHTFQWVSPREALDYVANFFGGEWKIQPNGTLDAGAQSDLFVVDPDVVVMPWSGGQDMNVTGINAAVGVARDMDDYTTRVVVLGSAGNGSANISPTPSYKDLNGNTVDWTRVVESSTTGSGNEATVAQGQLNRFSTQRRAITLDADRYDLAGDFAVGDTIWVYDPEQELVDVTNEVYYRGSTIHPIELRVRGHTWPVQSGMGVYFRAPDASGTVTDLTPYIATETGTSSVEVGATARSINS